MESRASTPRSTQNTQQDYLRYCWILLTLGEFYFWLVSCSWKEYKIISRTAIKLWLSVSIGQNQMRLIGIEAPNINSSFLLRSILFIFLLTLLLLFLDAHCLPIGPHAFAVFSKVHLQYLIVSLEAQNLYRWQYILPVDRLSLLVLALLAGLARNKRNKLRDALLNSLLGVLGDFGVIGQGLFHDPADIGNGKESRIIGWVSTWGHEYLSPCLSPSSITTIL